MSADNKMLVNDGLTALIVETLIIQKREECQPGFNPDASDGLISACKRRVALLRKMREEYEDEMTIPIKLYKQGA